MSPLFIPFEPQPAREDLPQVFPTPFRPGPPHALAERAAAQTQTFIESHHWVTPKMFHGPVGGKMFGVLVVQHPQGPVGYLRGFAGRLGEHSGGPLQDRWLVDGFVPPAFDLEAFDRIWGPGGAEVTALDDRIAALRGETAPAAGRVDALEALDALVVEQRALSRSLCARLHETYQICNVRGEAVDLRRLFEPRLPPGGAGDCAGPKLLATAHAMGARPLALAEFWWGAPPPAGGRQQGVFYPACRGRCAKILPFMLDGIECEPPPDFGIKALAEDALPVLYEDGFIVVVDKPSGLLSVAGRGPNRQDCVESRLRKRCGAAEGTWPRLVHRLDLATSGVLVAARDRDTLVALQRQFSSRSVTKKYVALLRGQIAGDAGVIDFPLGRDLEDRPRQMHDAVRGKPSVTEWKVLGRHTDTTRLALFPRTGRTHQLRVHVAHQLGLDAPIVGDWIYGFGGDRLMLHAESLGIEHPGTGESMSFTARCPF